jgi:hypothetical protein
MYLAIQSQPPGSVKGSLRITEQVHITIAHMTIAPLNPSHDHRTHDHRTHDHRTHDT